MIELGGVHSFHGVTRMESRSARSGQMNLAAIVESAVDAIINKTLDGVITTWSPGAERIFGFSANEIVGQSIMMIVPPDRHEEESGGVGPDSRHLNPH